MYESNEFHLCSICQKSDHINAMYQIDGQLICPSCILDGRREGLVTECEFSGEITKQKRCKHRKKSTFSDNCRYLKCEWICDKLVN